MTIQQKPKRRRGRPLKEDSIAIAADKAIIDYKTGVVGLVPDALKVLQTLLTSPSASDKVREGVAKFIIEEAKEFNAVYQEQDAEVEEAKPVPAQEDEEEEVFPISLEVR